MRRILVTGAGGYIGTVLVPMLLERGYEVIALDRFFFGRHLLPTHPRLTTVVEDVRRLTESHLAGVDTVIDMAAISNDPSGELFQEATWAINHTARVRCSALAKAAGVSRYVLPSSCSVYGFHDSNEIVDEDSPTNPLTTYAKANLAAEREVLDQAGPGFCVTVLRQATIYGYSPRMRFDLAINGMTYGAWKTGRLPLMRDGSQWRPMVHVADACEAQIHVAEADESLVNGRIFNVGSAENVYQIGALGSIVAATVSDDVEIEWYGDPDHRSYRVAFDKIEEIGWSAKRRAEDGVREIVAALADGRTDRTSETITLEWYKALHRFRDLLAEIELDGALFDIPDRR